MRIASWLQLQRIQTNDFSDTVQSDASAPKTVPPYLRAETQPARDGFDALPRRILAASLTTSRRDIQQLLFRASSICPYAYRLPACPAALLIVQAFLWSVARGHRLLPHFGQTIIRVNSAGHPGKSSSCRPRRHCQHWHAFFALTMILIVYFVCPLASR